MKKTLRYYQQGAVDAIYHYFQSHSGNPLVAIPTAGGKSLIIANFVESVLSAWPQQKILIATHVKELVEQNYLELLENWPEAPAGIYSASLKRRDTKNSIIFAGIASVIKVYKQLGHVDLLIVDEAHLVGTNNDSQYITLIAMLKEKNPLLKVIGLTATPYRLGLGSLTEGSIFDAVCYDLTTIEAFNRLIDEGYLCRLVTKKTYMEYDTDTVSTVGGEFNQKELAAAVDREDLTREAIKEVMYYGQDRTKWLLFATSLEHAEHITATMRAWGIPTGVVHSKMSTKDRDETIRKHKQRELRCLVNVGVLTTGYNDPEIDLIGVLRPTKSTTLWVQMLGRGMRVAPGKANCLVLDFAGNTRRLGPVNDPILPAKRGQRKGKAGPAPVKVCPKCMFYNAIQAACCSECGYEFPKILAIDSNAGTEEVMRTKAAPSTRILKIDRVTFGEYIRPNKPKSIIIHYYSGVQMHRQWMHLDLPHDNFAHRVSRQVWKTLSRGGSVPANVDEAMLRLGELKAPMYIKLVKKDKGYEDIDGYDFDGSLYGKELCT